MAYYKDLREYISVLEKNNRLFRIEREIDKDKEMHPLVRWQFRGLPQDERRAFLFEHPIDSRGKKYDCPVLVAAHAPCREVYALAMNCKINEISQQWQKAQANPVKPRIVKSGPAQEEVHMGINLLEHGGLEEFPIPLSTPGFDSAPFFTAGNWVSKDPKTGIFNVGNYRAMVKAKDRIGVDNKWPQHMRIHREMGKEMGLPFTPAAVVIGPTPNIGLLAATKIPYGVSEYDVAGGMAGEPVELVQCKSVDLMVPANAEIIIEGQIPNNELEREGPFGEYTGYIGRETVNLFMNITAITHRKRPIWNAFLSQFPPSESSLMTQIGYESAFYKFLKVDLSVTNLVDVGFHEASGGRQICIVSLNKPEQPDVWKVLLGAVSLMTDFGKIIIAVDDDIDPRDADAVMWAMCYRMQPDRDIRITPGKRTAMDHSIAPPEMENELTIGLSGSGLLINATRKWAYPPTSLPKKEFMDRAKEIWEEIGLPRLIPKSPWFGYELGLWSPEAQEEAKLALNGEYYKTGEKIAKNRVKG